MIDTTEPPLSPIKPRKVLNLAIGLVMELALGIGGIFFLESLDYTVKSAEEVERILGLPVLGMIPAIRGGAGRREDNEATEVERISLNLVTKYTPQSPVSEAYRTLRTYIQFFRIDRPIKTLTITSSMPAERKSTTVANLAITTALAGSRTMLVDADLRRPVIHSLFNLEREPGLINLLAERMAPERVIRHSDIDHLDILTCGAIPPNPSEL